MWTRCFILVKERPNLSKSTNYRFLSDVRAMGRWYQYYNKWKLKINTKKTKSMIFNRGNKLIKADFKVGDTQIENVKTFPYLGFTISAKNCNFQTTIDDLSIRVSRAIFSIRNKIKLSKLPV